MNYDMAASLYTDFQGLAELKAQARGDSKAAIDQVARQFEALYSQLMLKSMRQATDSFGGGIFDNSRTRFYRDMYDQQLALHLSEQKGIGLAEAIKRQLSGDESPKPLIKKELSDYRSKPINRTPMWQITRMADANGSTGVTEGHKGWNSAQFIEQLWPWAREAAGMLGLAPEALLAQAALETGWGKRQIHQANGSSANNLFGIKAGSRWHGGQVKVGTLEYEQGAMVRKQARFRAYTSLREGFFDYVDLIRSSPRYQEALKHTGDSERYFHELQQAGYATDPKYAEKIINVMNSEKMKSALGQLKEQGA